MQVEIWSDVVCPWCYLGKRHFERALEDFPHRDAVEVMAQVLDRAWAGAEGQ
jgi:predicted DsbA family dithiol-disulfide isomerase